MKFEPGKFDGFQAVDSGLYFGPSECPNGKPPETIEAFLAGHVCLVKPQTETIKLDSLEFVRTVEFGEARPSGGGSSSKWTGDNYKFYVFICHNEFKSDSLVLMQSSGGGYRWYVFESRDFRDMILRFCGHGPPSGGVLAGFLNGELPEPRLWDLLYQLLGTYQEAAKQGYLKAQQEIYAAFVEGRLKKKKQRGQNAFKVSIEPKN